MIEVKPKVVPVPSRFLRYVTNLAVTNLGGAYPDLKRHPLHLSSNSGVAAALEANASAIAREFDEIHMSGKLTEALGLASDWTIIPLLERGRKVDRWCSVFPATIDILAGNGAVQTISGSSFFARIRPGSRIVQPSSPVKTTLRCHLALQVSTDCGMKVGGTATNWKAGRCLMFDDTYSHAMWNNGEIDVVLLVADVWHHELSLEEVQLISGLERYISNEALRLQRYVATNEVSLRGNSDSLLTRLQLSRGMRVPTLFPDPDSDE
jgi:hypothetical protein